MNKSSIFVLFSVFFIIIILFLLATPRRGQFFSPCEVVKDTTIYRVNYRDTTIYDVELRDSVAYDVTLAPLTDFDTVVVRDCIFITVPMSWYHFNIDSTADVYATGYRVNVDSVRIHCREMTEIRYEEIKIRPKRLSVDGGLMMYGGGYVDVDVMASLRLGDRWSVGVKAGISTRDGLSSFAGVGVRYSLRTP